MMFNINTDRSISKLNSPERAILANVAGSLAVMTDTAVRGILRAIPEEQAVVYDQVTYAAPASQEYPPVRPSGEVFAHSVGIPHEEVVAMEAAAVEGARQDTAVREHDATMADAARSDIEDALEGVGYVQIP